MAGFGALVAGLVVEQLLGIEPDRLARSGPARDNARSRDHTGRAFGGSAMKVKVTVELDVKCAPHAGGGSGECNDPPDPPAEPPTLVSATVAANGTTVTLVFSEAVVGVAGENAAFTMSIFPLAYVSGEGTATVVMTYPATIYIGDEVSLSYLAFIGEVESVAGAPLAGFFATPVVNNSTQTP